MNVHDERKPADDPRLTAYALGELEAAEVAAIEALLAADPSARRAVDEVRAAAEWLQAELAREVGPGLTREQRNAIEGLAAGGPDPSGRAVGARPARAPSTRLRVAAWGGAGLAASVALAVGLSTWVLQRTDATAPGATAAAILPRSDARISGRGSRGKQADLLEGLGYTGDADGSTAAPPAIADPAPFTYTIFGGAPEQESEPVLVEFDEEGPATDAEAYDRIVENPFLLVRDAPLSTFSIDVDTASYANVRRYLASGELPPPDAVRVEELVNYFPYDYAGPTEGAPFAVHVETAECPWAPKHRLVRIGLAGREIGEAGRKASNLVFLIDVSGSMNDPRKLPLLVSAMQMLVQELDERDRVAIVVYAGAAGLVLPSTSAEEKWAISEALERLEAGGSTAGGAGIELAYRIALEHFIAGGVNRVILATDGDFNVGVSDDGSLSRLIEAKRETGVFLSVLGFGVGNLKDAKLEKLADQGNGVYAYIDSLLEARKVLVEELGATLETIAKDVKIQVEFNPLEVEGYRLVGYENRLLAAQDFADDTKDAGEIGAGHRVTAFYEFVPAGQGLDVPGVDPLKYQTVPKPSGRAYSGELLTLKLRYKQPDDSVSRLIETPVRDEGGSWHEAGEDLRFASAVAAFGMVLRRSEYVGTTKLEDVLRWASGSRGDDRGGYRQEFLGLVDRAMAIDAR